MIKKEFFYPLFIFIFLVNYHFYSFYEQNFFQMKRLLSGKNQSTFYEKIQSEHPYFEIWQLAQKKQEVVFVNEQNSDETLDYTTTYFQKKAGDKAKYFLSELKLMVNYYFYPKIIKPISLLQLVNQKFLVRGTMIISDFDLDTYSQIHFQKDLCGQKTKTKTDIIFDQKFLILYKRLERHEVSKKNYLIYNRHPEKSYYIYEVIN